MVPDTPPNSLLFVVFDAAELLLSKGKVFAGTFVEVVTVLLRKLLIG